MLTYSRGDRPIGVLGTGSYLPGRVVTNDEAAEHAGVTGDWVFEKTAIRQRRWAKPDEATSDLAIGAARVALADAGVDAADLALVVVATSTPDSPQPPTASVVAHEIGAGRGTAAFDVNAVCSGFSYGLAVAERLVTAAGDRPALVIGADVYSRILSPQDRRTVVLFGDGAGAAVIGVGGAHRVVATRLLSFAEARGLIGVAAGGSRLPASEQTLRDGSHHFRMDGRGVREFIDTHVVSGIAEFLAEHGVAPHRLGHLVPHQANGRILASMAERLGLPFDRVASTYAAYGNTGAAAVPITYDQLCRSGRVRPGDLVLLTAFGGGMSMGMTLLQAV
ncbi:3-oxoacyl-ACP synthase [Micromonospora sp. TSRI0369]|uniref:3-oxoacyl-ACP synthase III family protein n=1 Tax=Micromonospora sp. TSRI0369 TaxID=1703936 RepID=UPI00093F8384|nr:ketoacyl-ACP synthase III [Micromonospora sp. TSRI0369]OKJ45340.1 3-oxoacyl-ACP synthase [Micromonospora sp. TSRI0369]